MFAHLDADGDGAIDEEDLLCCSPYVRKTWFLIWTAMRSSYPSLQKSTRPGWPGSLSLAPHLTNEVIQDEEFEMEDTLEEKQAGKEGDSKKAPFDVVTYSPLTPSRKV